MNYSNCLPLIEIKLRCPISLLGCLAKPAHGFLLIFLDASSSHVGKTEVGLRWRKSLLGCLAIPAHRFLVVFLDARAVLVAKTNAALRVSSTSVSALR